MEQWVREQYAEISPENCILLNKMLGICPRIKKAVSLLSSIPQGNPQLSLRSSLTPCTQYYMGGGCNTLQILTISPIFKFGSSGYKSFRFFFNQTVKWKKNCSLLLTAHFCLNKIYSMKLCQSEVQIHAPVKKHHPALPGGEDIQLRWKI